MIVSELKEKTKDFPCLRKGERSGNIYLFRSLNTNPIVIFVGPHGGSQGLGDSADVAYSDTDTYQGAVQLSGS